MNVFGFWKVFWTREIIFLCVLPSLLHTCVLCMCAYLYVCMFVYMRVCLYISCVLSSLWCTCVLFMCACTYACMFVCMHVCMYVYFTRAGLLFHHMRAVYVCVPSSFFGAHALFVRVHVRLYMYMYICMFVCTYAHMYVSIFHGCRHSF